MMPSLRILIGLYGKGAFGERTEQLALPIDDMTSLPSLGMNYTLTKNEIACRRYGTIEGFVVTNSIHFLATLSYNVP
jgi:hypothetical protein